MDLRQDAGALRLGLTRSDPVGLFVEAACPVQVEQLGKEPCEARFGEGDLSSKVRHTVVNFDLL